jgi:nucleotide-binding universal stress UspA family protein
MATTVPRRADQPARASEMLHPFGAMISSIAVGTDGSDTASEAVKVAADLARRYGAKLMLLSASQDSEGAPADSSGSVELQWTVSASAQVREILARTESDLSRDGIDCATLVDEGDPADVLVRLATDCGADLLVIGNKGMHRRVLGSVPNTVTHKAPCSVLVVKTT